MILNDHNIDIIEIRDADELRNVQGSLSRDSASNTDCYIPAKLVFKIFVTAVLSIYLSIS